MKKLTNWHLNKFRGNFETYEDTYRYISERKIVSENLMTPADKVRQNYNLLKYKSSQEQQEAKPVSPIEAIASFVLVLLTFTLIAIILSNSK